MTKKQFAIISALLLCWGAGLAHDIKPEVRGLADTFEGKIADSDFRQKERDYLQKILGKIAIEEDVDAESVIYSPQGQAKPYKKSIIGLDWGESLQEDACTTIVFGPDNDVYIRDIILRKASIGFGSYVKGKIKDGKITVPVPQMLVEYEGGYGREVALMEKDADGEWQLSSVSEITYTYNEQSGVIQSQLPGSPGKYAIGLKWTFDDGWNEIGDFLQIYTPFDGEYVSMPDGIAVEEYYLNNGYYAYPVEVGADDEAVYIKGLSAMSPNAVIKAVRDGNRGYIPQNELVGTVMGYFIWTKMMVPDEALGWALVPDDEVYSLEIDMEKKIISSADPGQILILNCEYDRVFYLDGFTDFSLIVPESFAGTPRNPFMISYDGEEFREYYGINGFNFNISNISRESTVLDSSSLYYSIYIDGDILEFEEIENFYGIMYPGVEGIVTRMPFDFSNGFDIDTTSETGKFIGIYPDGATTVGVQAIYEYDGIVTYSDVVTINVDTGEITDSSKVVPVVEAPDATEIYFDLSGRRVTRPEHGVYILVKGNKATKVVC